MDIKTQKIYTSRHVHFIKNEFPFSNISSTLSSPNWYTFSPLVLSSLPLSSTEQRPSTSEAMLAPLHLMSCSSVTSMPPISPRTCTFAYFSSILINFNSSSSISHLVPPLISSPTSPTSASPSIKTLFSSHDHQIQI